MAYQVVHTFTIDTCDYNIMADFENQLVTCVSSCLMPTSVTQEQLGFNTDDFIAEKCLEYRYVAVRAQLTYPFAYIFVKEKAAFCGYVPPSCDFTFTTSSTNSTNGSNTGSITVSNISPVSPSDAFQYSLDNVIWQTSPVFNFLFPGTYNVYVRSVLGCVKNALVTVANTTTPVVIPPGIIPYQLSNRLCFFFRLTINGITYNIREPIKWRDVEVIGERDADFHGYQFKYSDGNFSLGFDCNSGREQIEAEYNLNGQDGQVKFHFGYTYEGVDYYLFRGEVLLNTRKWFADHIECSIVAEDIDTIFTSRLETKVSMTQSESFDGDVVPVPTPYNIELHAKEILTKIYEDTLNKSYSSFSYSPATDVIYIKPENTEVTFSETEDNYQYPLGDQVSDPVEIDEFIVQPQSGGTATIAVDFDMDIEMNWIGVNLDIDYTAKLYVVTKKFNVVSGQYDTTLTDITDIPVSGNIFGTGTGTESFSITGNLSRSEDFRINDAIYCFVKIQFENNNGRYRFNLTQNRFLFDWQYLEATQTTTANSWFLEDVIRHCINVITNNGYALKSEFLQLQNAVFPLADGCGSKYLLTNGFQIRNFDINNRPLKIDLKKALNSVNAQFCIGYNYNNDDSNKHIRIERRDFFYQNVEILAIDEISDYREEVAIDIIYNELEFGYNKYQDSGFNSLDEFNTKDKWLSPIKKNKKKLSQLSDFIASGYAIESIRRNQFSEKPSSSVTNDEEPHIISVKRIDATTFETEKDEAFETVSNLISPETSYNLRISPTRLLFNWFIWLKGIFAYKSQDDVIKSTDRIQNKDLITRFNTSETCRVGDANRSVIAETADVRMAELNSTADIYRPERVFIKCRLNPVEVQTINLAMTGRYGLEKDYGYIMVKKPTGVWQAFWLQKLSYNFATEEASLSGLMLFDSPTLPDASDCCNWLIANGCYILANGNKLVA